MQNGHREIVLTGIHLGHYGVDWNWKRPKSEWTRLNHLLKKLLEVPGNFRIRLSSIEATEVTRDLIGVMADHADRICPHLHICLQSGSDSVLRRMKRRWGVKRFLDRCDLVHQSLHKPALTTDIIVGFPGETEADFEASCDAARQAGFSKIHVFPFSARKGTPAAEFSDQISPEQKADRVSRLSEIGDDLRREYYDSLQGERLQLMIESVQGKQRFGTSCRYAPMCLDGLGSVGDLVDVSAGPSMQKGLLQAVP